MSLDLCSIAEGTALDRPTLNCTRAVIIRLSRDYVAAKLKHAESRENYYYYYYYFESLKTELKLNKTKLDKNKIKTTMKIKTKLN